MIFQLLLPKQYEIKLVLLLSLAEQKLASLFQSKKE
jgi:hypothetical protein